jgi:lipopolysaccharide export system permease protein
MSSSWINSLNQPPSNRIALFRPKLLHRTLFREQILLFALVLGSILGLALVVELLQLGDRFLSQNLSLFDIGKLLFYIAPTFLFLLVPLACMLAIFLTFLRMSTDREVIALKSGGISIYQVLPTSLVLCVLCTAISYWVSLVGLGWGMENFYRSAFELAKSKTQLMIQPGIFNKDIPRLTLYAQRIEPRTREMSSIFIQDRTRADASAIIVAARGTIGSDPLNYQMLFILEDGKLYREKADEITVLGFEEYVLKLDMTKLLGLSEKRIKKPTEMTWARLKEHTREVRNDQEAFTRALTEQHKRILLPLSSLILGLLALPLAFAFQGMRRHFGIILALSIFFAYFTIFFLGTSFGRAGLVSPIFVLWLPNIVLLALGIAGIRLAALERTPRLPLVIGRLLGRVNP